MNDMSPPLSVECVWRLVIQSCLTLCNPTECSPSGSSVHGILQARRLEWAAIPFSRGSSWPRDRTHISDICRQISLSPSSPANINYCSRQASWAGEPWGNSGRKECSHLTVSTPYHEPQGSPGCEKCRILAPDSWGVYQSNDFTELKLLHLYIARRSVLGVHWKDWCWSWNSNTLAPDAKSWLIGKDPDAGKDWGQEEKRTTEDEMVGWHHRLNGHGFGWTLGVGDGQGGLLCCGSWGHKERLNWTDT